MALVVEILKTDCGRCRIELRGRLDTLSSLDLDRSLEGLEASQFPVQVVDLKELNYISSSGLRSLYRAKKNLNEVGGQLLIIHPQPQVQKVFDIVKALPKETVFASQEELDDYLDAMQLRAGEAAGS